MKDIEIIAMVQKHGQIKKVDLLIDYHISCTFTKKGQEIISQLGPGFIPPGVRARMERKVNELFFPKKVTQEHFLNF